MYYLKLDFTAAFFNIPLKDSSKFVTTFIYNDIRYYLNRLPFGLSISPFVFQRFLNSIVNEFKEQSEHVWAHIHDILIAHESKEVLNSIVKNLLEKLIIVDWKINIKKSVLKPTKNLIFLGAIWNFNGITRTKDVTTKLKLLWRALIYIKATSENQRAFQLLPQFCRQLSFSCEQNFESARQKPVWENCMLPDQMWLHSFQERRQSNTHYNAHRCFTICTRSFPSGNESILHNTQLQQEHNTKRTESCFPGSEDLQLYLW